MEPKPRLSDQPPLKLTGAFTAQPGDARPCRVTNRDGSVDQRLDYPLPSCQYDSGGHCLFCYQPAPSIDGE